MTEPPDTTLELSPSEMKRLVAQAMERMIPFLESLPFQPTANTAPGLELAHLFVESLPTRGIPAEEILDSFFEQAVPHSLNVTSPGYLAYIAGGGLFQSAVAELIAYTVNRYVGVWDAAPVVTQIEATVIQWFCEIVGFPPTAGGLLTSGGSLANFYAVVAARQDRLPENFLNGIIYTSTQSHHSIEKAARIAGFPLSNLRRIGVDSRFRIRLGELESTIDSDLAQGLSPFLIVGNGGTTNTGAVDSLSGLGELARRRGLWFHVDAAYGGFFMLTEQGRSTLQGIEQADSVTLNPHKGLFLPWGTGSLLVQEPDTLRQTFHGWASYMPDRSDHPLRTDFSELSPELSREFRGLRVWLPIKMHGIEPFRRNLEEKLELAAWITQQLRARSDLEILAEPQLSLLAFRWVPPATNSDHLDRLNQELLERINQKQRVYLTSTVIEGNLAIRICVLSFRTHKERMEMCLEDIRDSLAELSGEVMS